MATDSPHPKPLTFDEAVALISEIARNGEGAEKFRALKMVMAQESASVTLPEPMSDHEIIDRLARLIRAAGPTAAQLAYRRAFPAAKTAIYKATPKIAEADVAPVEKAQLPTNLRALYRMFPEIKQGGQPKGFPRKGGLLAKKEWCQREAMKMILDKEQKRHDQVSAEAASDATV